MLQKFIAVNLLFVFFVACSNKDQFPEPISAKIPAAQLTIDQPFYLAKSESIDSLQEIIEDDLPGELLQMKELYEKRDAGFDLQKMEVFWNDVRQLQGVFSFNGVKQWIEATGFLLGITGKEMYAAELEHIQYVPDYVAEDNKSDEIKSLLESYIFTRNTDFFHVNLFTKASVQFEHSLFGHIKITQQTDFPSSGNVNLKFILNEKRYMEIFVRIPKWAEGATVTVKNVKYIAPPGDYCQIAKSWENNDLVEIHFPTEKMPDYLVKYN